MSVSPITYFRYFRFKQKFHRRWSVDCLKLIFTKNSTVSQPIGAHATDTVGRLFDAPAERAICSRIALLSICHSFNS
jgi:hypothetical protein